MKSFCSLRDLGKCIAVLVLILLSAGCGGGAAGDTCEDGADCDNEALYCLKDGGATEGVCTEAPSDCGIPLKCTECELSSQCSGSGSCLGINGSVTVSCD